MFEFPNWWTDCELSRQELRKEWKGWVTLEKYQVYTLYVTS